MIVSEWLDIAATIRDRWPNAKLPDGTLKKWGSDLSDLDSAQIAVTYEAAYRDGRAFPPNPGEIRKLLIELTLDVPDWAEAYRVLRRIVALPAKGIGKSHLEERDGHEVMVIEEDSYPRREALNAAGPMLRAFYESIGFDQVYDGASREASGSAEARLREKWVAFVRSTTRDAGYIGLKSAGLPRIERVNREPVPLAGAVRRALPERTRG